MSNKAKELKAKVFLITTNQSSKIAEVANNLIVINAVSKDSCSEKSIQPMGTLFEQGLLLITDSVVLTLMEDVNLNSKEMYKNHANLE